jgi:hypothetical protein
MMSDTADVRPMKDPEGQLEKSLINEFIRMRGHEPDALESLSEGERTHLLAEASVYAAGKLAEIEARAHFVHEIHHAREDDGAGRLP